MNTSKFKKFGIPGALVIGGITAGSFLAPIGLASAQTDGDSDSDADSTESTDPESTESSEAGKSEGRRGRHARAHNHVERTEVLTETLNLTEEEIRQGFQDGKSLADLAGEQGVAVADVQAALVAQASERLDEAVEAGRIDADEAAEKLAEIETKIAEKINANPADFQGREGRGGKGRRGGVVGGNIEALEETLGLSSEEIRAGMVEGKSLSDLAAEQGVSVEDLAATLTAGIEERIDQAVEAGKIDADRAAEAAENIEEKVEEMLTREFDGERMGRGEGRRGNRGQGHSDSGDRFGAPADDATADVEESSYSA